MFCKVCRDAGCSEEKYTSHYVRSSGQVVCPTLLNQACRNCKHTGHTSSYCPDRKPRDHRDDHYQREREEPRRDDRYQREEPYTEVQHASIAIDIRKVDLHHAAMWCDEDNKPFVCPIEPIFVCDPEEMCREFMIAQQAEAEDLSHRQCGVSK